MKSNLKSDIKNILNNLLCKINPSYKKISIINKKIDNFDKVIENERKEMELIEKLIHLVDEKGSIIDNRLNNISGSLGCLCENSLRTELIFEKKTNVKISIICLIYKSVSFAKAVHDSLYKYTPELLNGEAELLFVANDASEEVIKFLKKEKYNFVINNNKYFSDADLFKLGYGTPEYINRVYAGYNCGIKKCNGDIVVLINSDNMFSPNWLENLLDNLDDKKIVCSQLVERNHPKFGIFPKAILGEFGSHPNNYKEKEFLRFAKKISKKELLMDGAYMPCMVYKKNIEKVGYYPEGNIAGKSFNEIVKYGDERFYDKLDVAGVKHYTVCNSIVYHFKEGEKED